MIPRRIPPPPPPKDRDPNRILDADTNREFPGVSNDMYFFFAVMVAIILLMFTGIYKIALMYAPGGACV